MDGDGSDGRLIYELLLPQILRGCSLDAVHGADQQSGAPARFRLPAEKRIGLLQPDAQPGGAVGSLPSSIRSLTRGDMHYERLVNTFAGAMPKRKGMIANLTAKYNAAGMDGDDYIAKLSGMVRASRPLFPSFIDVFFHPHDDVLLACRLRHHAAQNPKQVGGAAVGISLPPPNFIMKPH